MISFNNHEINSIYYEEHQIQQAYWGNKLIFDLNNYESNKIYNTSTVSSMLTIDAKIGDKIIRKTPFGNSLTIDLAKAAIDGEQLGADDETDLQSSLTLSNSCSSLFTLKTMAYVSVFIPFVLAYIIYAWRAIDRKPITADEMKESDHAY